MYTVSKYSKFKKKSRNPNKTNSSLHASVSFYKYGIRTGVNASTPIINFDRTYSCLYYCITFILTIRNLDERNISRSLKKKRYQITFREHVPFRDAIKKKGSEERNDEQLQLIFHVYIYICAFLIFLFFCRMKIY